MLGGLKTGADIEPLKVLTWRIYLQVIIVSAVVFPIHDSLLMRTILLVVVGSRVTAILVLLRGVTRGVVRVMIARQLRLGAGASIGIGQNGRIHLVISVSILAVRLHKVVFG